MAPCPATHAPSSGLGAVMKQDLELEHHLARFKQAADAFGLPSEDEHCKVKVKARPTGLSTTFTYTYEGLAWRHHSKHKVLDRVMQAIDPDYEPNSNGQVEEEEEGGRGDGWEEEDEKEGLGKKMDMEEVHEQPPAACQALQQPLLDRDSAALTAQHDLTPPPAAPSSHTTPRDPCRRPDLAPAAAAGPSPPHATQPPPAQPPTLQLPIASGSGSAGGLLLSPPWNHAVQPASPGSVDPLAWPAAQPTACPPAEPAQLQPDSKPFTDTAQPWPARHTAHPALQLPNTSRATTASKPTAPPGLEVGVSSTACLQTRPCLTAEQHNLERFKLTAAELGLPCDDQHCKVEVRPRTDRPSLRATFIYTYGGVATRNSSLRYLFDRVLRSLDPDHQSAATHNKRQRREEQEEEHRDEEEEGGEENEGQEPAPRARKAPQRLIDSLSAAFNTAAAAPPHLLTPPEYSHSRPWEGGMSAAAWQVAQPAPAQPPTALSPGPSGAGALSLWPADQLQPVSLAAEPQPAAQVLPSTSHAALTADMPRSSAQCLEDGMLVQRHLERFKVAAAELGLPSDDQHCKVYLLHSLRGRTPAFTYTHEGVTRRDCTASKVLDRVIREFHLNCQPPQLNKRQQQAAAEEEETEGGQQLPGAARHPSHQLLADPAPVSPSPFSRVTSQGFSRRLSKMTAAAAAGPALPALQPLSSLLPSAARWLHSGPRPSQAAAPAVNQLLPAGAAATALTVVNPPPAAVADEPAAVNLRLQPAGATTTPSSLSSVAMEAALRQENGELKHDKRQLMAHVDQQDKHIAELDKQMAFMRQMMMNMSGGGGSGGGRH